MPSETTEIDVEAVEDARERFEEKYVEYHQNQCWPWIVGRSSAGYGVFHVDGEVYNAHRVAWVLASGEDPGEAFVLHHCDHPNCVNPNHLYLGDQTDNVRDAMDRDRHVPPPTFIGESHPAADLTEADVLEIRARYDLEDVTQYELAAEYGVSQSTIGDIINEVTWTHV